MSDGRIPFPLDAVVGRVRDNYTAVCKCEWDDYGASSRMTTNPECVIHGEATDPLDELIAAAELKSRLTLASRSRGVGGGDAA